MLQMIQLIDLACRHHRVNSGVVQVVVMELDGKYKIYPPNGMHALSC